MSFKRVRLGENGFMGELEIALVSRRDNQRFVEHYDPETRKWRLVEYGDGCKIPNPTIRFDMEDAVEIYLEMHAFFSSRGIRNKDESFIGGELVGTKRHLSDLRHLLKLPPDIVPKGA